MLQPPSPKSTLLVSPKLPSRHTLKKLALKLPSAAMEDSRPAYGNGLPSPQMEKAELSLLWSSAEVAPASITPCPNAPTQLATTMTALSAFQAGRHDQSLYHYLGIISLKASPKKYSSYY